MARNGAACGVEIEEANAQLLDEPPAPAFARLPGWASLALLTTGVLAASAFVALLLATITGHATGSATLTAGSATRQLLGSVSGGAGGASAALSSNYCPTSGENCTATRCCADPGYQCYKKNSEWASCLKNCSKGKKLKGDPDSTPWDCEEFGPRNMPDAGVSIGAPTFDYCASRGDDCRSNACCAGMGDSCYLKNPEWGSCQPECDPTATLTKGWGCQKLY